MQKSDVFTLKPHENNKNGEEKEYELYGI